MPADSDPPRRPAPDVPPLPVRIRPLGVRIAAPVFGGLLLLTAVLIWVAFPEDARASFTPFQRVTLVVIGGLLTSIGHALARSRIDADETGLLVVNGYRSRHFDWAEVVAVTLRPGNPWAVLDLSDGTSQAAMGIQGSDGARAQTQVRRLRALVEAHAGSEPPAPPPEEPA